MKVSLLADTLVLIGDGTTFKSNIVSGKSITINKVHGFVPIFAILANITSQKLPIAAAIFVRKPRK